MGGPLASQNIPNETTAAAKPETATDLMELLMLNVLI